MRLGGSQADLNTDGKDKSPPSDRNETCVIKMIACNFIDEVITDRQVFLSKKCVEAT
jgi:hypothetical protein